MNAPAVPATASSCRSLGRVAAGAFLMSLFLGLLVPVYTDEIGWRFQLRAGIDDGLDIMVNDLCGPNTIVSAPWFMMPVRWFSAAANQALADPLFIRIEGVACAMAFAALMWVLIGRLEGNGARRGQIRSLAFALLGLGTLPLLMVLSRPEQPLLLTTMLMILLVFVRAPSLNPRILAWTKVAAIAALACIGVSYHLKGVVFAPIALACVAVCSSGRGTLAPRLAGAGAVLALMSAAGAYWAGRFQCPGDPKLAAMLAGENIAGVLRGGGELWSLLPQMLWGAVPLNYVWLAVPDNDPVGFWMPPGLFPLPVWFAIASVITLVWMSVAIVAAYALVRFIASGRLRAVAEPRVVVAMAILASTMVWGGSQLNRNAYEAAQVLPLLAVFAVLCLTLPLPGGGSRLLNRAKLAKPATIAAVLSQVTVLVLTAGPLLEAARIPGYLDAQPNSVSISGYADIREDIRNAMKMAGMPEHRRLRRLLIDDVTYLDLQGSSLPLHRLGVLGVWNGSITDPVPYLRSRNSDGVVIGCRYLTARMRQVAAQSGAVCAISRSGIDRLAGLPGSIRSDHAENPDSVR